YDASLFEMANGAAADERFGDLVHFDRGLHAGVDTLFLKRVLQGQGVDDGGQHAHVVGGNAVHLAGLFGHAAEKVPAADDDGDLHAQRMNVGYFAGNFMNAWGIDAKAAIRGESLTRKFEKDALEDGSRRHALQDYQVSKFGGYLAGAFFVFLRALCG